MPNQGESEFARTPVLEHFEFFTCVQCGYCGYLILGGSAKKLQDEEERHAIECKATHGMSGARSRRACRAEASGSAGRWPSEVDYSSIYRDCEVVMNAQPYYDVLVHGFVFFVRCAVIYKSTSPKPLSYMRDLKSTSLS